MFLPCTVGGMLWFGLLGFWDDLCQSASVAVVTSGMSERSKLLLQALFSAGFAWLCVSRFAPLGPELATKLYVPFVKFPVLDLGPSSMPC